MSNKLYKNGINFKCQGSSNCCVSRNNYGFVYLSNKDLLRFSKFYSITKKKFIDKYCNYTDGFLHLKEIRKNGECLFLNKKKCSVYKARPSQCRTWPFWNENMNAKVWNEDISINCPGIGKGKKIKSDIINKFLKEDYENEKSILKNRITRRK